MKNNHPKQHKLNDTVKEICETIYNIRFNVGTTSLNDVIDELHAIHGKKDFHLTTEDYRFLEGYTLALDHCFLQKDRNENKEENE